MKLPAQMPPITGSKKLTREEAVDITKETVQKTESIYYGDLTAEPVTLGVDEAQTIPGEAHYWLITDERFRTMADLQNYMETVYTAAYIDREFTGFIGGDTSSADGLRFKEHNGRLYLDSRAGGLGNAAEIGWDTLLILSQEGERLTVKLDEYIDGGPSAVMTYTLLETEKGWRIDEVSREPFAAG